MGISIPEETMVAVKLSGGAARTDDPVNNIVAMKKTDTRQRILTLDMTSSFVFLKKPIDLPTPTEEGSYLDIEPYLRYRIAQFSESVNG
jgi:hypothetical protein